MGTKVYFKSYPAGYYPTRDLNEDATSTWPLYYEDRILNGQFCNGVTSRPVNGYSENDKELLKQTMLRHEEIFRKQVLELHRLYRIQRDLMVELKRKGEQSFSVQAQSSQPSPYSTQIFPQEIEKSWQEHAFSSTSTSYTMATVSGVDDAHTHLSSLNGTSFQSGLMSREDGISQGVKHLLDSKPGKIPRRMIDLQLPAEAYMENDDTEHAEEKDVIKPLFGSADLSNGYCGLKPENDVNLTLDTAQNASNEIKRSISHVRNGFHPHKLADLNEPLKEVSCEEVGVSSRTFPVQMTTCEGLEGHQKPTKSASSFLGLQKDLFHDRYKGEEVESVFLCIDRGERGQKWPFYNNEIGQSSNHANSFTSSLSRKDVQPSFEPVAVWPNKTHDFSTSFSPKPSETESWLRGKRSLISELPDTNSYIVDKTYSGLTIPTMSIPLSALPCTDYAKTASPLVLSRGKSSNSISHIPIEIQALSCFSGSTPMNIQNRSSSTSSQNLGNAWEKWKSNRDFKSSTSFGREKCLYPNGLHHGFLSERTASSRVSLPPTGFDKPTINNEANSLYEKSEYHGRSVNLNLAPPNGFWNGFAPLQKLLGGVEGKKESLSVGISCLTTKSSCSEHININKGAPLQEFGIEHGCSQTMSKYCTSTMEVDQKKEIEDSHADFLQDLSSILKAKETKTQQNESSVCLSFKTILGFPVPQCSKINFTSISHQEICLSDDVEKRVNEEFLQPNPSCLSKLLDSDEHIHVEQVLEKGVAEGFDGFRDDINLNARATSIDQTNSRAISSKDEIELTSPVSAQGTATRFVSEIDLEAPITSLSEEKIPSAESASNCNQLASIVEPDIGAETLVRIAAETIHKISSEKPIHSEDITLCPLPPASADILHWFADAVISKPDLENVLDTSRGDGDGDQESSDIDGMDYFEYMTLKLKETKVDEYCCRHLEKENPKEEETGVAHLLMTRPRRGQVRKRCQRRDFQKDILPGLASLSRYEVTEDLQMIGGLMRASGQLWQPCGTRRNTGRNRSRCQAKGTCWQKSNAAAAAVVEISVDHQLTRPNSTDIEIDVRGILGWGRTTRRCRRQRCSSGNILVPPPS